MSVTTYEVILEQVVSAAKGIPLRSELVELLGDVEAAQQRGYFMPHEDERLREHYRRYLRLRVVLLGAITELEPHWDDQSDWEDCIRCFAVAYTAACVLMRSAEFVVDLAGDRFLVWKKLDEAESRYGIPRRSFSAIYKNLTSPRRMWRFYEAVLFWELHAEEVMDLRKEGGRLAELIDVLKEEIPFVQKSKKKYLRRQLQYRVFSFKRRQHSGFRKVMFQLFRIGGNVVAEAKQPKLALKKQKRVTPRVLAKAWAVLQPGDIIVTRHDEALSNLFLPGFWPHVAMYVGSEERRKEMGIEAAGVEGANVVEAKKDGVKLRALTETLAVDAFVILRPQLNSTAIAAAVRSALSHVGKRYDFVFDFRQSDRLACTELVYRAYQAAAGVDFQLEEHSGRLCLPAEALMNQGIEMGTFEPVAMYGVGGMKVYLGNEAKMRLWESYAASWEIRD
ncbi:YiiX/YebB-like N1pC/P60 family cysteine hydrolase [Rubritalea spongiae]|uniref:YiiX/YebB-like N1pC/P60 family cysteine hydrolase n=1 Tax=Rubritalea spongiae TaxID=430797 RepID=A0ABW5E253_9BACT